MSPTRSTTPVRDWPNLVTVIRLVLLPVFLWLLFSTDHRAIAAWLLASLGATDWIDGFLARACTRCRRSARFSIRWPTGSWSS